MIRDCPEPPEQVKPLVHNRVYASPRYRGNTRCNLGYFSIFKHPTKVLIDPSSTHSFISHIFKFYLDISIIYLNYTLVVSTLMNDVLYIDVLYKDYTAEIAGREFGVDLVLLDIRDFDIILRIN